MIYLTDRLYSGLNLNLAQIAVSTGPLDKEREGRGGIHALDVRATRGLRFEIRAGEDRERTERCL